jgi:hypothetical protein
MAETSHEIRHDIELTRERVGGTIAALERKVNPKYLLDDHPLAAVGIAFGTGVLLATTGAASRAAHEVKDQFSNGAASVNDRASGALDSLLHSVLTAASGALTAKLSEVLESAVSGATGAGPTQRAAVRPPQAPPPPRIPASSHTSPQSHDTSVHAA